MITPFTVDAKKLPKLFELTLMNLSFSTYSLIMCGFSYVLSINLLEKKQPQIFCKLYKMIYQLFEFMSWCKEILKIYYK